MSEQVNKAFRTVNRRFNVGDTVSPEDIQGAVSFERWKELGFIGAPLVQVAPVTKWSKNKTDDAG